VFKPYRSRSKRLSLLSPMGLDWRLAKLALLNLVLTLAHFKLLLRTRCTYLHVRRYEYRGVGMYMYYGMYVAL
jgi:hypothetical protein